MDITTVPREVLSMQDSGDCDYNRTPAIFQVPDVYCFVGDMTRFNKPISPQISYR